MYFYVIAMKLSWYKFATKEYIITLSDIYKIWRGQGVFGPHPPSHQISALWVKTCGQVVKNGYL